LNKYVAILSSLNHPREELTTCAREKVKLSRDKGWNQLFAEHAAVWDEKWKQSDVIIDGDLEAQQAIRFSIFQLNQTYNGNDARLNISPKGFTGEKYAGATRWDTEAVCVPFYLCTAPQHVSKNLLLYRYRHLQKAIINAKKLGFENGAALFPLATFNGSESHNEWELSFEEIHRNGLIAYAVYNYVKYTGDESYLIDYGLRVLIALSRFWSQRVSVSEEKKKFVILGVTGPNMYENNVNNNWFTNYIAVWTLKYTLECIDKVKKNDFVKFEDLIQEIAFLNDETFRWKDIIKNMYYPTDKELGIFVQQGGFLDKTLIKVVDIPENQRPVNQHWTWDRILRSSVIKQADVVQGLYLFEEFFDLKTLTANFNFYEPLTVHESSVSASTHSIVASAIGDKQKAYDLYLQTARLDLDDYNNEVSEGLHITSMAGTWLAIVQGFGGMRVKDNTLHFSPHIPDKWISFAFNIRFRENQLNIRVEKNSTIIHNLKGDNIELYIDGKLIEVLANSQREIKI
jgi:maltose phosphorylase